MNIITSTSFIQSRDEKIKQSSQLPTSNFKKKTPKKKCHCHLQDVLWNPICFAVDPKAWQMDGCLVW